MNVQLVGVSLGREYARVERLVGHVALLLETDAAKTVAHYDRALRKAVRDFYNGDMTDSEFIDEQISLITEQFTRAWNEGMRDGGLSPEADMTEGWSKVLGKEITDEQEFILDYAQAIQDAAASGEPIQPLLDRVDLWANRYNEIVDKARLTTRPEDRYVWHLGATEKHCSTCAALDGIVASGSDWKDSGYHPQGAPNEMLECGGWRCDCRLEPTDDPVTPGGIPSA